MSLWLPHAPRLQENFDSWVDETVAPIEQELVAGQAPLVEIQAVREADREHLDRLAKTIRAVGFAEGDAPD